MSSRSAQVARKCESSQSEGIAIAARELHAARKAAMRLLTDIMIVNESFAEPGNYRNISLSAHIHRWYREKYGERLAMDLSGSKTIVQIKGDFYEVRVPFVLGRPQYVFDSRLIDEQGSGVNRPINVAKCIKGLTPSIANSMSEVERFRLQARVQKGIVLGQLIEQCSSLAFIKEAKAA